jgi:hypothetical protein
MPIPKDVAPSTAVMSRICAPIALSVGGGGGGWRSASSATASGSQPAPLCSAAFSPRIYSRLPVFAICGWEHGAAYTVHPRALTRRPSAASPPPRAPSGARPSRLSHSPPRQARVPPTPACGSSPRASLPRVQAPGRAWTARRPTTSSFSAGHVSGCERQEWADTYDAFMQLGRTAHRARRGEKARVPSSACALISGPLSLKLDSAGRIVPIDTVC